MRHIALSGIAIDILDDRIMAEGGLHAEMMKAHFLIKKEHVGMKVCDAFKDAIEKITMFSQITCLTQNNIKEVKDFSSYGAVLIGYKDFSSLTEFKPGKSVEITDLDPQVPVMLMKSYGKYGIAYTDLGKSYQFKEKVNIDMETIVSLLKIINSRIRKQLLLTRSG